MLHVLCTGIEFKEQTGTVVQLGRSWCMVLRGGCAVIAVSIAMKLQSRHTQLT
jgi:hypothetical protein